MSNNLHSDEISRQYEDKESEKKCHLCTIEMKSYDSKINFESICNHEYHRLCLISQIYNAIKEGKYSNIKDVIPCSDCVNSWNKKDGKNIIILDLYS